jgi:cell division protein ZapA (FtsZ GTPase activity inhibitor)
MQDNKKNINLFIGGVNLPIVIAPEDESLLREAAILVDQQISERRHKNTIIKPLDITAIMVALSTASKLLIAERTIDGNIQEQLKPHLESIQQELNDMNIYADGILQKLEI